MYAYNKHMFFYVYIDKLKYNLKKAFSTTSFLETIATYYNLRNAQTRRSSLRWFFGQYLNVWD